jgi:Tol biopolymer transport system component
MNAKPFAAFSLRSLALALAVLLTACAPQLTPPPATDLHITITADGETREITTRVLTVREALTEAGVALALTDKLSPSEFTPLIEGMVIRIIRVTDAFEIENVVVPFKKETISNEGLPAGESRLLQTGENGSEEVTYRTVYEDGVEVQRSIVRRVTTKEPVSEIIMVGAQTSFTAIPITGTLVYRSVNNAWLMRDSSGSRKPLTTTGDLDGRVFTVSPDGRYLLYTRNTAEENETVLSNELWGINTTDPNAKPFNLKVENVLWAEWSPTEELTIAYTTAEPNESAPGWLANNDLYVLTFNNRGVPDEPELRLESSTGGLYGWFGTNFSWSPDGSRIAFSQADKLGIVDTENGFFSPIATYSVFQTNSDWVWNPDIAWSPDSRYIYTVLHGPPIGLEAPEDSPVFDVAVVAADGTFGASLIPRSGMWANPLPSPNGEQIAFMQAVSPLESKTGQYRIMIMDRDGSNPRTLFPPPSETGLIRLDVTYAWSPDNKQLAVILKGNLWVVDVTTGISQQLTGDGQTTNPSWAE